MFEGHIILGNQVGRTLGFPTANIDISAKKTGLAEGVYAASAEVDGKTFHAACLINLLRDKVEVHLLEAPEDFDIYGKLMKVEPIVQVSKYTPITNLQELREKIASDIIRVKEALNI